LPKEAAGSEEIKSPEKVRKVRSPRDRSTRPEWRGARQLTNRQRIGVEKKMIVFVIDALAVLYAVEEMGKAA